MSDQPRWHLRPPTEADVSFIFNSFLKSFRDSSFVAGVPNTIYYKEMHAIIERLLGRASIVIACDPGQPELIFGYAIGELDKDVLTLHWIYTKHAFRNFGMGKAMEAELLKLPHASVYYSCRTPPVFKSIRARPDYKYDPFKLWCK